MQILLIKYGLMAVLMASRVLTDVRRLEVVLLASVGLVALFFLLLRKFTPGTLSGISAGEDHT